MWRRALATWAVVATCGCSFAALEIRLATQDASPPDASVDAPAPDAAPEVQRSCVPPVTGCGQARIAGGTFAMGDTAAVGGSPVQPSIAVRTFMLDRYEVTVARFRRFVDEQRVTTGFDTRSQSSYCNWPATAGTPGDREGHPMNCVEWQTAQNFCQWDTTGGTLPTEAQWEYAARGPSPMSRSWPWGGSASDAPGSRVCWNHYSPKPLGTCLEEDPAYMTGATPDGVWHLVGNVWEWTADAFRSYSDTTCWNEQARRDPICMIGDSGYRSIRGGSWSHDDTSYVRSGARLDNPPTYRIDDVGFRCAGTAR